MSGAKESWGDRLSNILPELDVDESTLALYTNIMMAVIVVGSIPLIAECYRGYTIRDYSNVPKYAFIFQALLCGLWIIYGLLTRNAVIMISSSLIMSTAMILVYIVNSTK